MSVAVTNKTTAFGCPKDGGLEHPKVLLRAAKRQGRFDMNAGTVAPCSQLQQVGVCDVFLRGAGPRYFAALGLLASFDADHFALA